MINNQVQVRADAPNPYYAILRKPLLDLHPTIPRCVLEVGCGTGLSLQYLKRKGAAYAVGLELRTDVADIARKSGLIDEVLTLDVEQDPLPIPAKSFDLIILSHVLEHFANPDRVLQRLIPLLSDGGHFLIAVPNVRHLSVLLPLLFRGEFDYQASGIMDYTHLRFFTRRSLLKFLSHSGLLPEQVAFEVMGPKSRMLTTLSCGLLREFTAYAINVRARPSVA